MLLVDMIVSPCFIFTRMSPQKRKMMVGGCLSLVFLLIIIIVTTSTIDMKQTPTPGDQGREILQKLQLPGEII